MGNYQLCEYEILYFQDIPIANIKTMFNKIKIINYLITNSLDQYQQTDQSEIHTQKLRLQYGTIITYFIINLINKEIKWFIFQINKSSYSYQREKSGPNNQDMIKGSYFLLHSTTIIIILLNLMNPKSQVSNIDQAIFQQKKCLSQDLNKLKHIFLNITFLNKNMYNYSISFIMCSGKNLIDLENSLLLTSLRIQFFDDIHSWLSYFNRTQQKFQFLDYILIKLFSHGLKHDNEVFNELFNDELTQELDEKICNIQINNSVLVQQMLYERQHHCSCSTFGMIHYEQKADSKLIDEKKILDSIIKSKSKERRSDKRFIKKVTFARDSSKNKKSEVQKTNLKKSRKNQITIKDLDLEFN
ncbi:hypothetical protein pb186bvf_002802 [Paramecium bursaria]